MRTESQRRHNYNYYRRYSKSKNSNKRWTDQEIKLLIDHSIPDIDLHKKIERSLKAIHVQRSKLKKGDEQINAIA